MDCLAALIVSSFYVADTENKNTLPDHIWFTAYKPWYRKDRNGTKIYTYETVSDIRLCKVLQETQKRGGGVGGMGSGDGNTSEKVQFWTMRALRWSGTCLYVDVPLLEEERVTSNLLRRSEKANQLGELQWKVAESLFSWLWPYTI